MKDGKITEPDERIIVKCDHPNCGWYTDVESIAEIEENWFNRSCPNCGKAYIISRSDIDILKNSAKTVDEVFGGKIFQVDTAMRKNLVPSRQIEFEKEYPKDGGVKKNKGTAH